MTDVVGWQTSRLGDLVKITSGQSPSQFRFVGNGTPYFKVEQLGRSEKYLTRELTPYLSQELPTVPAGSVLFAKRGGAIALNRIRILSEPAFMDTNVMALTASVQLLPEFLYFVLSYVGLGNLADVTSIPQINNKHIIPFKILLPPVAEQQRIVDSLGDLDQVINSLERLIAKKQAIKQGMMQQLLTGKTRLPGFDTLWVPTAIGSLGSLLKGRGVKRDDARSSGVPCIRYGELYTTFHDYTDTTVSFVSDDVAATALPIGEGDLLFAGSGETKAEIGTCVAYVGLSAAVAGGDIIVLRAPKVNAIFLASLLNTPEVAAMKSSFGQGDAVVHINARAIGALRVNLPEKTEQDAIAQVIVDVDQELKALATRLVTVRDIKQGMMQELLTGRTRLTSAEVAA